MDMVSLTDERQRYRFTLCIKLTLAALFIDYIFHDQLFRLSGYISHQIQYFHIETFSYFFSKIFFYSLFVAQCLLIYFLKEKEWCFLYTLELTIAVGASNVTKMFFRDLRPSFVFWNLKEGKHFCENDYGMPSSHTFLVFNLLSTVLTLLSHEFTHIKKSTMMKISIGCMTVVSATRIFLGVHSISQVTIGCLMGVTLYFGVEYYKPWLLVKIIHPLTRKRENRLKSLKKVALFMCIYTATIFVVFLVCQYKEQNDPNFLKQIVHCQQALQKEPNFSLRLLCIGLMAFYGFGNYMGVYIIDDEFQKTFDIRRRNKGIKWRLIEVALVLALTSVMHLERFPFAMRSNRHIKVNIIRSIVFNFLGGFMNTYGLYKARKFLKRS